MSTVIDTIIYQGPYSFNYHGKTYITSRRGSEYRLARTHNGDVVIDANSGLYRIKNWQIGQRIFFRGLSRRADLNYDSRTGFVIYLPNGRPLLQLDPGLNPRSVRRHLRLAKG